MDCHNWSSTDVLASLAPIKYFKINFSEEISAKCSDDSDPVRVGPYGLEKMFNDLGVDVAFWAHVHLYERTWPVNNKKYETQAKDKYEDPKWVTHVITGSAGNKEDLDTDMKKLQDWSAVRMEEYSFTTMTASKGSRKSNNQAHLCLESLMIKQWSKDETPKVIDHFQIIKTHNSTSSWYERAIKWLKEMV